MYRSLLALCALTAILAAGCLQTHQSRHYGETRIGISPYGPVTSSHGNSREETWTGLWPFRPAPWH